MSIGPRSGSHLSASNNNGSINSSAGGGSLATTKISDNGFKPNGEKTTSTITVESSHDRTFTSEGGEPGDQQSLTIESKNTLTDEEKTEYETTQAQETTPYDSITRTLSKSSSTRYSANHNLGTGGAAVGGKLNASSKRSNSSRTEWEGTTWNDPHQTNGHAIYTLTEKVKGGSFVSEASETGFYGQAGYFGFATATDKLSTYDREEGNNETGWAIGDDEEYNTEQWRSSTDTSVDTTTITLLTPVGRLSTQINSEDHHSEAWSRSETLTLFAGDVMQDVYFDSTDTDVYKLGAQGVTEHKSRFEWDTNYSQSESCDSECDHLTGEQTYNGQPNGTCGTGGNSKPGTTTARGGPANPGVIESPAPPPPIEYDSPIGAALGNLWDNIKLYDEGDVKKNFDNLSGMGYSSSGLGGIYTYHTALMGAIGERVGVGGIEDARSGRDAANEALSNSQRALRGLTGAGAVAFEAVGLKGSGGAIRSGLRKVRTFFSKPATIDVKDTVQGKTTVYQSLDENGSTNYVGITDDLERRAGEQLRKKGIEIDAIPGLQSLPRDQARAVEQVLINVHGLSKNGGTLINKINSIAESNPKYAFAIQVGREILSSIGYPGF